MTEKASGFWSGMPGILTGIAAVITALTGLYAVMDKSSDKEQLPLQGATHQGQITDASGFSPEAPEPEAQPKAQPKLQPREQSVTQNIRVVTAFPQTGPLLDCSLFPTVNTTASLMSWSNYYHKQIIAADGVKIRAVTPCNKTIDQRGMAHCKAPDDAEIRQALLETLQLCRTAGIEWQDIQHSTIIGK